MQQTLIIPTSVIVEILTNAHRKTLDSLVYLSTILLLKIQQLKKFVLGVPRILLNLGGINMYYLSLIMLTKNMTSLSKYFLT